MKESGLSEEEADVFISTLNRMDADVNSIDHFEVERKYDGNCMDIYLKIFPMIQSINLQMYIEKCEA